MRGAALGTLFVAAACGRIGFTPTDTLVGPGDAPGDTLGDGGPDAVMDGAPACLASYELCDGFEGMGFAAVWTVGNNVTLDTTVAHRGTSSVHFHSPALPINTDGYYMLRQYSTLPLGDPTTYVRAWVRLGSMPLNNMGLLVVEQNGSPDNGDDLTVRPTDLAVYSQFANLSRGNATTPPLNTWFCVLWTVTRATTATGSVVLGGDPPGKALPSVQTDDATSPLAIMDFGIGFSGTVVNTPQPALDVWMDDVIVSGAPLACSD
jgi:hypothetical protein